MYFLLHLPLHKRQALSPIEEKSHSAERKRCAFSSKRNPPRMQPHKRSLHMQLRKSSFVPQPSKGTDAPAIQECTSHPKNFDTSSIKIQSEIKLSYYTKSK